MIKTEDKRKPRTISQPPLLFVIFAIDKTPKLFIHITFKYHKEWPSGLDAE